MTELAHLHFQPAFIAITFKLFESLSSLHVSLVPRLRVEGKKWPSTNYMHMHQLPHEKLGSEYVHIFPYLHPVHVCKLLLTEKAKVSELTDLYVVYSPKDNTTRQS